MNKRQAKKRNKKFGCKKWCGVKHRIVFYNKVIKPIVPPKYVLENFLNSEVDDGWNAYGAFYKKHLEKASKIRHATFKFLPDEFWAIEEEV